MSNDLTNIIEITKCEWEDANTFIQEHLKVFAFHMDSWPEERLIESEKFIIILNGEKIGYTSIKENSIFYFYVRKEFYRVAPSILEKIIEKKEIKSVFVLTQDTFLSALIAEWDYEKKILACGFTDLRNTDTLVSSLDGEIFRVASQSDCIKIREMSGDFFEEPGAGFSCLEDRITAGNIFLLMHNDEIMGGGIMERSKLFKGTVSIGMFTNSLYRKKGVAVKIILSLKKQSYRKNLLPVAGCWYYNTLSRKSLEAAGMIVTTICFEAILKDKEKLPLRTGNPPGELMEVIQ
jgi:hypothetical protein